MPGACVYQLAHWTCHIPDGITWTKDPQILFLLSIPGSWDETAVIPEV